MIKLLKNLFTGYPKAYDYDRFGNGVCIVKKSFWSFPTAGVDLLEYARNIPDTFSDKHELTKEFEFWLKCKGYYTFNIKEAYEYLDSIS